MIAHQAYLWGIKAAQDGQAARSNPYLNASARAAWEAGRLAEVLSQQTLDQAHRQNWDHLVE